MKTEISLEESRGKTIEFTVASPVSSQFIICFTDGTFTTLEAVSYGDSADVEASQLKVTDFSDRLLIDAGIVTADELAEMRAKREQARLAYWEEQDRKNYERLQAKFGP